MTVVDQVPQRIQVFSADRDEPIGLLAEVRLFRSGRRHLPYVTYTVAGALPEGCPRSAVCLAGGGSSGVLFGRLGELCAERGVLLRMLDLPGHTPDCLVDGEPGETPGRRWIRYLDYATRTGIIAEAVERSIQSSKSGRIGVVTHSAGFYDASHLSPGFRDAIERIFVLGAGLPGLRSMRSSYAAAADIESTSKQGLFDIIRTRSIETGQPEIHFGSESLRSTPVRILESYQGPEHYSLVLRLLRERSLGTAIWQGADVCSVGSAGDRIAPPERRAEGVERLEQLGARCEMLTIEGDLPHMFMAFERGARFVSDVICESAS